MTYAVSWLSSTKGSSNLAASQHHSTAAIARDVQDRPRSGLVLVPKGAKRTIVILSLALAGCQGPINPVPPTTEVVSLRFLTDGAPSPLLHELTSSYRPAHVLVTWDIQVGETYALLDLLKAGQAPYMLTDYLPAGFGALLDSSLWTTPVGQDGIAIVVNPANPVANLSGSQLRALLQGRVGNWQEIGGSAQNVTIVAYPERSSATAIIQAIILGDRHISSAARLAPTSQAVVEIVASDPGAIGYISMGYLDSTVRAVPLDSVQPTPDMVTAHQYPVSTPIVFVGLHEPGSDSYREFFAWGQRPEGQAIVKRNYGGLVSQCWPQ